jgi:hypothetical protein
MSDGIRKLLVPGVFGAVIAGVWTLGALKAELDSPLQNRFQVDPAIVQRALLAVETDAVPPSVADTGEPAGLFYWFAS